MRHRSRRGSASGSSIRATASTRYRTTKGFFIGIFKDSSGYTLMTTDRSSISENEKFQFVMYGLASPVVIQ